MARIAFLQNIWAEILGVLSLSASLKKHGHVPRVFIEPGEKNLIRSVCAWNPDLIAFSVSTGTHPWALETARKLKKAIDRPIILGGNHPTLVPSIISKPEIDMICNIEGESLLVELADRMDAGLDYANIPGLTIKAADHTIVNPIPNLLEDLDSLPFFDRELYRTYSHFRRQTLFPVITTRGCSKSCAFCHNHAKKKLYTGKGSWVRTRSVDNVIEELEFLKKHYALRSIYFWDDTFGLDKEWFYRFLGKYRERIAVPFFCFILPGHYDEQMVRELKASGCQAVPVALETGNEKLRREVLKKDSMTNDVITSLVEWLHRHQLPFGTLNMMGFPGETLDHSIETLTMNRSLRPFYAWTLMFQPYPGTDMSSLCLEQNLIEDDFADRIGPHWYNSSTLSQSQISQQINLHKLFDFACKMHLPIPLVRRLVKLPSNPLFDLIYLCGYARYNKFTQGLNWKQFMTVALNGATIWFRSGRRNR